MVKHGHHLKQFQWKKVAGTSHGPGAYVGAKHADLPVNNPERSPGRSASAMAIPITSSTTTPASSVPSMPAIQAAQPSGCTRSLDGSPVCLAAKRSRRSQDMEGWLSNPDSFHVTGSEAEFESEAPVLFDPMLDPALFEASGSGSKLGTDIVSFPASSFDEIASPTSPN